MQKEQREFGANNVMSTLIDRLAAGAPKIGCGNVLIELAVPKNKDADNEKRKQEHHYWRVIVTYNDGETSGNRVFKDREKAEEWAARQEKSPVVKKAVIEPFMRDAYAASRVHGGIKRR